MGTVKLTYSSNISYTPGCLTCAQEAVTALAEIMQQSACRTTTLQGNGKCEHAQARLPGAAPPRHEPDPPPTPTPPQVEMAGAGRELPVSDTNGHSFDEVMAALTANPGMNGFDYGGAL
jgi:hypothetical protein